MPTAGAPAPTPPEGMRVGQMGIVTLGRVIIGDISVTLVDLSLRHLLLVDEQRDGDRSEWRVWARPPAERSQESLLRHEQVLLDGLSQGGRAANVTAFAGQMPEVLRAARSALIHDAVHRGWMQRLHHDRRTEAGERLAVRIRAFQHGLRLLAGERGEAALTGPLLPYALHFGMIRRDQLPLARFARHWTQTFADLPGWGEPGRKRPSPPGGPVPIDNAWPWAQQNYWI